MNQRTQELLKQATDNILGVPVVNHKKFAELIVRECMKESMDEIVADEDLATENDPLIREYLLGCNQGVVDAVVRFRNHFGVEE